jgi:hypothetical protein
VHVSTTNKKHYEKKEGTADSERKESILANENSLYLVLVDIPFFKIQLNFNFIIQLKNSIFLFEIFF